MTRFAHGHHVHGVHHGVAGLGFAALLLAAFASVFGLRAAAVVVRIVAALFLLGTVALSALALWHALQPPAIGVQL